MISPQPKSGKLAGTRSDSSGHTLALPCFTLASFIGLALETGLPFRRLLVWGTIAGVLAMLTILARREKRLAERRDWHREQRDIAVHLALRSLQATVPELLARVPEAGVDATAPVPPASSLPGAPTPAATAHSHDPLPSCSSPAGTAGWFR